MGWQGSRLPRSGPDGGGEVDEEKRGRTEKASQSSENLASI